MEGDEEVVKLPGVRRWVSDFVGGRDGIGEFGKAQERTSSV